MPFKINFREHEKLAKDIGYTDTHSGSILAVEEVIRVAKLIYIRHGVQVKKYDLLPITAKGIKGVTSTQYVPSIGRVTYMDRFSLPQQPEFSSAEFVAHNGMQLTPSIRVSVGIYLRNNGFYYHRAEHVWKRTPVPAMPEHFTVPDHPFTMAHFAALNGIQLTPSMRTHLNNWLVRSGMVFNHEYRVWQKPA